MSRPIASLLVRSAVVGLVLAVVLCLVLPMSGGDAGMRFALACCFLLVVALSVFLLRRPAEAPLLGEAFGLSGPVARGPTRMARAPDVVALGSLLI